jgi:hypothetical protein
MACNTRNLKKRHLKKSKYKLKNWAKYTQSLKNRGDIFVWIDKDADLGWVYSGKRRPGGKVIYSDKAIEMSLKIRSIYHQPLRQTQGLIEGIFRLMKVNVTVPDYTTVSRRAKTLDLNVERFPTGEGSIINPNEPVYMIIDSTGLKVYGAGEWHVKKHGVKARRSWRKCHLSVTRTGDIQAGTVTDHRTDDASQVPKLQEQVEEDVAGAIGDGAYDVKHVYQSFIEMNPDIRLIIPPRSYAVMSEDPKLKQRNEHIDKIQQHGREAWENSSGYTQQARAENTMFRYKTIFGGQLRSRTFESQENEVILNCSILNKMRSLGMPDSYRVA